MAVSSEAVKNVRNQLEQRFAAAASGENSKPFTKPSVAPPAVNKPKPLAPKSSTNTDNGHSSSSSPASSTTKPVKPVPATKSPAAATSGGSPVVKANGVTKWPPVKTTHSNNDAQQTSDSAAAEVTVPATPVKTGQNLTRAPSDTPSRPSAADGSSVKPVIAAKSGVAKPSTTRQQNTAATQPPSPSTTAEESQAASPPWAELVKKKPPVKVNNDNNNNNKKDETISQDVIDIKPDVKKTFNQNSVTTVEAQPWKQVAAVTGSSKTDSRGTSFSHSDANSHTGTKISPDIVSRKPTSSKPSADAGKSDEIIKVGSKSYRLKPLPETSNTAPPRKPAKPPSIDLSAYRQTMYATEDSIQDEIYDDVSGDVVNPKARQSRQVSIIEEYTEEEESGRAHHSFGGEIEEEIYDDVVNGSHDGEIYQELD